MTQKKDSYMVDVQYPNLGDGAPEPFEFTKHDESRYRGGYETPAGSFSVSETRRNRILLGTLFAVLMGCIAYIGYIEMRTGRSFWTGLFALAYFSSAAVGFLYQGFFKKGPLWLGLLIGLFGPLSVLLVLCKGLEFGARAMPGPEALFVVKRDMDGHHWLNDSFQLD